MEEKIIFMDEDGNEVEFTVIEETRINNMNYILVADEKDEETTAYIMKDTSSEDDLDASYVIVDNDDEIEYVMKIFDELLGDDIKVER
jgi:uncharacterized protein YrzB (UPF0473 family)